MNAVHIHFIAIGGAAMHALAIALSKSGYRVTGSDDEILEPSRSRLLHRGLLPDNPGWYPEKITSETRAVILGMHARKDNPELLQAQKLDIKVYSYPEYLYEKTRDKCRVVIAGSHGKTTITSMVMHVLKYNKVVFDYMVGSQVEGFDNTVNLQHDTAIAVFEGDEYLSSALDQRPKFHVYQPKIALISGIAWDHVNVFPTYELYKKQFSLFMGNMPENGLLIYCEEDNELKEIVSNTASAVKKIPYSVHVFKMDHERTYLITTNKKVPLEIFGNHNLQNISGARLVCNALGINDVQFYNAISGFKGAGKRLQLLARNSETIVFLDFAHSPSKVKATLQAVKEQFPTKELIACLELHTFSSLTKSFISNYRNTMKLADQAVVFYNPDTIAHKRLEMITPGEVMEAFNNKELMVFTSRHDVERYLGTISWQGKVLLLMSSGNFAGINFQELADRIIGKFH
jgi:UDP-N-acetylmuramate: L-alanyl-gamma-D-glutamyl-meso-diaminopimelate ligase